ncbi:MAG TPA: DUF2442 domain-containing protein [Chlamydiales bacterium]|nr:DUF2442 domain-containing protein [Chlamydiales bacterium]
MSHIVKKVEWLGEYKLKLHFDNGKIKTVDLASDMKKAKNLFLDLVDIDYFKQVKCDGYSIIWPNGIDYCPDVLYSMGENVSLKIKRRSKRGLLSKSGKSSRSKPVRRNKLRA